MNNIHGLVGSETGENFKESFQKEVGKLLEQVGENTSFDEAEKIGGDVISEFNKLGDHEVWGSTIADGLRAILESEYNGDFINDSFREKINILVQILARGNKSL